MLTIDGSERVKTEVVITIRSFATCTNSNVIIAPRCYQAESMCGDHHLDLFYHCAFCGLWRFSSLVTNDISNEYTILKTLNHGMVTED